MLMLLLYGNDMKMTKTPVNLKFHISRIENDSFLFIWSVITNDTGKFFETFTIKPSLKNT